MPGGVLKELVPFQEDLGLWISLFYTHGVPDGAPDRRHPGHLALADGAPHAANTQLLGQPESRRSGTGGHFVIIIHGCYQYCTKKYA